MPNNLQESSLTIEKITQVDKGYLFLLQGDLDSTNVEDILQKMKKTVTLLPNHIIADFKELRYINSTGIGILLEISKEAKEIGCSFKVCQLNSDIQQIIDLVGVTPLLEIFATRDAALASCN